MSQFDYGNIDPLVKDGTALANDLNLWRDALESCHMGASRPSYARAGIFWIKNNVSPAVYYFYDGFVDIAVAYIDFDANTFTVISSGVCSDIPEEMFVDGTDYTAGTSG